MSKTLNYLDLFAGAGGLSEGFMRAGFKPIAHVEMDRSACFTLRTRRAYHSLKENENIEKYAEYLKGAISRSELYEKVPKKVIQSVINAEISATNLPEIFNRIDSLQEGQKIDLIIGGPPCQAYSVAGRARCPNKMKGDKRNHLYVLYAEFLNKYRPECFLFENVPGLLSATDEEGNSYLQLMRDVFYKYDYETEYKTLSTELYGVPQARKRTILFGKRGTVNNYPEPGDCPSPIRVRELLADLPSLKAGKGTLGPCDLNPRYNPWLRDVGIRNDAIPVTLHQARPNNERDLEIYEKAVKLWNQKEVRLMYDQLPPDLQTHKNRKSFLNRFRVVAGNLKHSHTVVAHIAMDGHYYIHYDIEQNRSLTPREAARLQTFPDDYYFESGSGRPHRTPAFRQIGNAVPVLLAEKIAEKLKENWL